jgi:4-amino-4-deoxy-L-arabinose transferase-like glycosyltransferase
VSRLRGASRAPVAVAGILAVPLFFAGLMAFSLKFDKPSHHLTKKGIVALGNPTKGTVGTIYLLAFGVGIALVVVGVLAMLLRSRLATIVPAVAAIIASVLLILPLATWAALHTRRYPLGADNIPQSNSGDQFLRGEWEQTARSTAHQVALVTIGLALTAIALTILLEVRRRRGIEGPAVPPPPEVVGAPEITGG